MKIGHLLFLCWISASLIQAKILTSQPATLQPEHRELGWITDTFKRKDVAWGMLAGVPALAGTLFTSMPNRDVKVRKTRAGRRLKYEQTLYETRHSTNKQMATELEEIVHRGDTMLREFQKEALNRINGLRSDIQLKFKDYGASDNKKN